MKTIIKQLRKSDQADLKEFFSSLSKKIFYNWNRFGDLRNRKKAGKVAREQVNKSLKEEKGLVVFNGEGEITGYGYLRYFPDKKQKKYTTSLGIVIGDKFQGQGLGKKLMIHLLKEARKKKMKKVWLGVYVDNKKAIKLYQKFGFEIEGIFMYDEYFGNRPRHIISLALFLDKKLKNSKKLREKIENENR